MAEVITHEGIVVSTDGEKALVRIMQAGGCQACRAKQMCASSESREKDMDVVMMEPMVVGDKVQVIVTQDMGWIAVILAYVIPFILLIAGVGIYGIWLDEAAAGTLAILTVGLWYLVLKLMDGKIKKRFSFKARKI